MSSMDRLQNKRTIVTGAGAGIGKAIAARFIQEGATVLVADVDVQAAKGTAAELGDRALAYHVDVREASQVQAMVAHARQTWGGLDVLVNNAGVGVAGTVEETTEEDWQRIIDITLKGTFLGMKYGIPAIRESGGGSVINIASIASLVGLAGRAAYSAAKGGVLALTRAAAIDHVGEGVRVNCIAPGTTDTPWIDRITASNVDPKAAKEAMRARQPHGRFVAPEEIAAMAAYLASDEAGSVIGAAMIVDGGMTAR